MKCDFSLDHYAEILVKIKELQYKDILLGDTSSDEKVIVLRHDIDLCPESALKMAKIEFEYNICSTYFVWLQSPFYNALCKRNILIFNNIQSMGHKIGLHIQCKNKSSTTEEIMVQFELLNKLFGITTKFMSFHKPNKELVGHSDNIAEGILSAYAYKYIKEYKYISDSGGEWRDECLCHILGKKNKKIQALIHPVWWNSNSKKDFFIQLVKQNEKYWHEEIDLFCCQERRRNEG